MLVVAVAVAVVVDVAVVVHVAVRLDENPGGHVLVLVGMGENVAVNVADGATRTENLAVGVGVDAGWVVVPQPETWKRARAAVPTAKNTSRCDCFMAARALLGTPTA